MPPGLGLCDRLLYPPCRSFAVKLCRDAVGIMTEGPGSNVYRLDQPFQRMVRDINTMSSHVAPDLGACNELHGRVLLECRQTRPSISPLTFGQFASIIKREPDRRQRAS